MLRIEDARIRIKNGIEQLEKLNLSDAGMQFKRAMEILNHPALLSIEIDTDTFNREMNAREEAKKGE